MYTFEDFLGDSEEIVKVRNMAKVAARTSSPLLVYGETGTGKEVLVQAIHNASRRCGKRFIPQNCAAIPKELIESEFFGVEKGGFTGAESKIGLFEMADGGTLYLDELNSMPYDFQGKLLRVLQDGEIRRVGGTKTKEVDVRVISSVNENPERLVEEGRLRKDLYYRLNVIRIDIPSLNERKDDIPIIVDNYIKRYNKKNSTYIEGVDKEILLFLISRKYKGNVRELEHILECSMIGKKDGIITKEDLGDLFTVQEGSEKGLREKLEEAEKIFIKEALTITGGNVTKASEYLKIPRQTLQYRMKKLKIK